MDHMSFAEKVQLRRGAMLEIWLGGDARYRLRYGRPGAWLVVYENGRGHGHRRTAGGRAARYEFRSVEQLRYDFERDVAAHAQG
jgi:hypothetical protein